MEIKTYGFSLLGHIRSKLGKKKDVWLKVGIPDETPYEGEEL